MFRSFFEHLPTSFFNRAFPPPGFLRMPAAGLDISETTIRYINFGSRGRAKYVKYFGERKLPTGAINSGYIYKPEEVIKNLKSIKEETNISFVNVSLPEEKAYLFKMQVPRLDVDELRDAIGFRIEENVPVSAKEAIYDFIVLDGDNGDSDHVDVMVSVIPSKVSEAYAHVVKAAGLTPLTFEISSQAISRVAVPFGTSDSYLVFNIGDTKTGMAIVSNGLVFFTSTIPLGSAMIDEVIAKTFGISSKEVPDLKTEVMSSGKQDMKLFLQVMESVAPLKEEIKKLSVYWKTHSVNALKKPADIEKIVLCGSDVALPAVYEYVNAATGIKTEVANVWQNVFSFDDYIPPIPYSDALNYAGAIGLALGS